MSDQHEKCQEEALVHQYVKVQAQVTVTPYIHGEPKVYTVDYDPCRGEPECKCASGGDGGSCKRCTFTVSQVLCIEVPISFDVDADVDRCIVCGKPIPGPCDGPCGKDDGGKPFPNPCPPAREEGKHGCRPCDKEYV